MCIFKNQEKIKQDNIFSIMTKSLDTSRLLSQSSFIFLKNISGLFINLQRQKYEKLTQTRLSLLEKLFIHEDKATPEIRFEDYMTDWSMRSLYSIITPYTDYLPTPTDGYTRLGIRSHMKGTFYEYVAPSKQVGKSGYSA